MTFVRLFFFMLEGFHEKGWCKRKDFHVFFKKIRIQVEEEKKKMVDGKWENSMKDDEDRHRAAF